MKALLNNERDLAALVLRLGFGFFIVFGHGLGKLQMLLGGGEIMFPGLFGLSPTISLVLAVGAEFFAGLLVMLGFKTRLASLPVIFTMAVAASSSTSAIPSFLAVALPRNLPSFSCWVL